MAREIVSWCDVCLMLDGEPHRREAKEFVVQIGRAKPRRIDVCELHEKELLAPLQTVLADAGVVVDPVAPHPGRAGGSPPDVSAKAKPTSGFGDLTCRVPDCRFAGRVYASGPSFSSHLRNEHNMLVGEYRARYLSDDTPPTPGETAEPAPVETMADFTCGIDGCTQSYDPAKFTRPAQALAVHKARMHGVRGRSKSSVAERERAARRMVDAG